MLDMRGVVLSSVDVIQVYKTKVYANQAVHVLHIVNVQGTRPVR
jgi:hypothetical protein